MTLLKSTLALLGLTFVLAACETVPAQEPIANAGRGNAAAAQMDQVFAKYTPIRFKAVRIGQMRQQLSAAGWQKGRSSRSSKGQTFEQWRGTVTRNGKVVSQARINLSTCENSTIVYHSRTTLDDMTAEFAREVQGFIRSRRNIVLVDERQTQGGQRMRFLLLGADGPYGRNATSVPRGKITNALGGLRIFDNGDRRLGITINSSCG